MKKFLSIFLTLMLTFTMSACNNNDENESNNLSEAEANIITVWHDKEDAIIEVLDKHLKSEIPEIDVNFVRKDGLTEALKLVGNDPKAAPDMYIFAHDKIGVYAEMGILEPIKTFIEPSNFDKYLPLTIESASYKGEVYQLPLYFETLLFMYNNLYMPDAEVPETTEELYTYMQENTKGGHYGFVEQHSTAYYSAGWIHAFGGEIISAEGEAKLNTDEVISALKYHKKFTEYMPVESEYATVNTLFQEGKAHSTIGGPWLVAAAKDKGLDISLAPMPIVDVTNKPLSPYSGTQGIHVLKVAAEAKKEAISKVLKALRAEQLQIDLAEASGAAPALKAAYEDETIRADEMVMAMYKTAENAVPMPNIPEMDVMWSVTDKLLVDINMSGEDVKASAEAAQAQAENLIEQMH